MSVRISARTSVRPLARTRSELPSGEMGVLVSTLGELINGVFERKASNVQATFTRPSQRDYHRVAVLRSTSDAGKLLNLDRCGSLRSDRVQRRTATRNSLLEAARQFGSGRVSEHAINSIVRSKSTMPASEPRP